MNKCPACKKSNDKILVQDEVSYRKSHRFICGNCRTEFNFHLQRGIPTNFQLQLNYDALSKFQLLEAIEAMEDKISGMTEDEMLKRLEELDKKR